MKKSMALCLAACAGALSAAAAADVELIAQWNDFSSMSSTNGSYTLATSGNTTVTDGVLNVVGASGGTAKIDISGAGLSYSEGFTLSFAVSNIGSFSGYGPFGLVSLATGSDPFFTVVGYNSSTSMPGFSFNGTGNKITSSNTSNVSALTSSTPQIVTLTFLNDTITFYMNGVAAGTGTIVSGSATEDNLTAHIATIGLGSWVGASSNGLLNENIYNFSIYRGAMNADQVRELVPEPATATLSLLALAGLAARRRRK